MNKKGVTILELLISIALISIVILLLIRVIMSLKNINNQTNYASEDEIMRTELIKSIESSFIEEKLNGLKLKKEETKTTLTFLFANKTEDLLLTSSSLTYKEKYELKSSNASFDLNILIDYIDLEDNYYYITISISVVINEENTTKVDDIIISYLGLKNEYTSYELD